MTNLLPSIDLLGHILSEQLNRPEVQAFIADLTKKLSDFAKKAIDMLPQVFNWILKVFGWLNDNRGVVVAVLAAIGVAIATFAYTSAAALFTLDSALLPAIAVMLVVALVAYLLYQAWTQDWGGIQEKTAAVWAWLQPIFTAIKLWLAVNIPIAIAALSRFWYGVLLPAIQQVWKWMQTVLFPFLGQLANWLLNVLGQAIHGDAMLWTQVLWPAIQAIWKWLSTVLWPFLVALANFFMAVLGVVLKAFAVVWTNILLPAITAIWNFLSKNLQPAFKAFSDFMTNTVLPIIKAVGDFVGGAMLVAFNAISEAVQGLTDLLNTLAGALNGLTIPPALMPGSPTPFEMGLRGIGSAIDGLVGRQLPGFNAQLNLNPTMGRFAGAGMGAGGGGVTLINYGTIKVEATGGQLSSEQLLKQFRGAAAL